MIAFGNEELEGLPEVSLGDAITCPQCHEEHILHGAKDNGVETDELMFYRCGMDVRLGAVNRKLVIGALKK